MKKPLPIGISDFKELIEGGYAYVDKTLFIQELIERKTKISLIPRLRRFGKTLNLSMLRYFFEKSEKSTGHLFESLKIWQNAESRVLQGRFPVIFLSLKDIKFSSWEETFTALAGLIAAEFGRHQYLMVGEFLNEAEKQTYQKVFLQNASSSLLARSLLDLSQWLHRYHKEKVILLIDEYDAPAHAAYIGKYYDQLIGFLRNWLSAGLKDNSSLERGVLTGILRIAKESIFSGLNNIETFTILSEEFQDKFGLLESEVKALLSEYDLLDHLPQIRKWYNGYRIGSCTGIYNPWSVLCCIRKKGALAPYWVNTSDNALIKQLFAQGSDDLKTGLEELLQGKTIAKTIEEGIIFADLKTNSRAVWSLLVFSGYLTIASTPTYGVPCELRIPNAEVNELYTTMVVEWFEKSLEASQYQLLLSSLTSGDIDTFSRIFQRFLLSAVSVFDVSADQPEKIYHAFVLGMLIGLSNRYEVKSNRESGYGRYDVMLIPKNPKELGIVMEFKKIDEFETIDLEEAAASALEQIEKKRYAQELQDRGVQRILRLALAFKGKHVLIRSER
jgi:hypothetical protein